MCGIAGLLDRDGVPDIGVVRRMSASLAHRGPDGAGEHADGPLAMASRRLALVDPAGGAQPLRSEDGSVVAVCNGELYDHRTLRRDLEARGHRFATGSDCEVLVHRYEELGPACFAGLRGMFAAAIWDARRSRLVLARDPFGIKPLFLRQAGRELAFASELRALLGVPGCSRELDPMALEELLACNAVLGERTLYREIRELAPGAVLVADPGATRTKIHPRPGPAPREALRREPLAVLAGELREALARSVRAHLDADVEVGLLLSGGLDSGALAALAPRPLRAFTVGFDHRAFDETDAARRIAGSLGLEHRVLRVTWREVPAFMDEVAITFDEPRGDATALPYWLAAREASRHVKAVLSGEGADELLGGYQTYVADRLGPAAARAAALAAPALERLVPASAGRMRADFAIRRLARGAGRDALERHLAFKEIFSADARAALLLEDRGGDPAAVHRGRYAHTAGAEALARLQDVDVATFLADDLLVQADRAAMAHGVEVRVPYLDPEVVALARMLPVDARVRGRETKRVLRAALDGRLPPETVRGPKRGFVAPVAAWLRGPLRSWAADVLAPDVLRRQGLVRPQAGHELLARHVARREDLARPLWTLIALSLWSEVHRAARDPSPAAVGC